MGRAKEISEDIRARIVALRDDGCSIRQISTVLKVSKGGVQRTLERLSSTGSISSRKRSGRPPKLSKRDLSSLIVQCKRNRRSCSRELTAELHTNTGVVVTSSAVRRILLKYGLRGCIAVKKPFVSPINRLKRLRFAKTHQHWTEAQWMTVLFTDEKKFNMLGSDGRVYVRRRPHEALLKECMQGTVKGGGGGVMMWGSFSGISGPGPMVRLDGRVTAQQYLDAVLKEIVLPYADDMPLSWVYQHDNAPIHKARVVTDWLEDQGWTVVNHPPQSPDLNPIENLWNEINKDIKKMTPRNLNELEKVIKEAWRKIPTDICAHYARSMKKRCKAVIASGGLPTKY